MEFPHSVGFVRRSTSIGAEIVAHFEQLISSGELAPGTRLPSERELATSLNVSRTSLREAMHELEVKNMVARRPGRGTIVTEPHGQANDLYERISEAERTLRDVAELRETIEPRFAELAARRITDSTLIALEDVLAKTRLPMTQQESIELDISFHMLIAQASQNRLLVALGTLANEWTASTRALSHADSPARRLSHEGHHRIYLRLRERDAEAARQAMLDHLSEVADMTRTHHPSF
ncbi:FadR family transcriptional regulator [Gordonia sp. zg691]|uniref:FadR family transcriptional regulator n=1 Tax=Gordonia jinghuaiqii TaxID=2758710 RepID=A0A7D7LVD7_9ACTN|nr:FadR/GntR family transcriptional regulator [Gordonia jinghuaiqii]MBD0860673.1 FadR family transcriptional regulator [Gordonia jinghuaiqii]MCR5978061.1 GntR family transcriptional regulator [Gordonia jinghuaiqii]QMT01475.1 FadR family transcriptional regulator [Gordonia jinghuaiqii]